MRFTAASIAFFAGLAAALPNGDIQTVYTTEDVTITSCAPTVTNCPGRATSTPEGVGAVTTPAVSGTSTGSMPVETPSASGSVSSSSSSVPVIPVPTNTAPASSVSVIAITTCVPTVIYSTVPVATPTSSVPVIPSAPSGTPSPIATPSVPGGLSTGAGNTLSGSFIFAGAAAAAAFFLA